jgi:peroxiredoxin
MKNYFMKISGLMAITLVVAMGVIFAQQSVPSAQIKDLTNRSVDTKTLNNDGKPYILCFWATWCKPCLEEMKVYNENYEEWVKETGLKLVAVSIDDSRNSKKVAPFVKGKGWKFEVYIDENQDFMRSMNVTHPPHTFIINGKGEVAWSHIGFAQGDEEELIKAYKEIVEKEKTNSSQAK